MEKIISFLKSNPNAYLRIVDNTDELCSHCPRNIDEHCIKWSVDEIDSSIIESAKLCVMHIYTVREVFDIINKTLVHDHIVKICSDCIWKKMSFFY
jgi:uncharacterized protein